MLVNLHNQLLLDLCCCLAAATLLLLLLLLHSRAGMPTGPECRALGEKAEIQSQVASVIQSCAGGADSQCCGGVSQQPGLQECPLHSGIPAAEHLLFSYF